MWIIFSKSNEKRILHIDQCVCVALVFAINKLFVINSIKSHETNIGCLSIQLERSMILRNIMCVLSETQYDYSLTLFRIFRYFSMNEDGETAFHQHSSSLHTQNQYIAQQCFDNLIHYLVQRALAQLMSKEHLSAKLIN